MQKLVTWSAFRCEVEIFTQCMLKLNDAVSLDLGDLAVNIFFPLWFGGQKVTGLHLLVVGIEKWRFMPIVAQCHLTTIIVKVLVQSYVGEARADFSAFGGSSRMAKIWFFFLTFCLG